MPWQLREGLERRRAKPRRFRGEPKPLAECLPQINVNSLPIPRDYGTYRLPDISLRYPWIASAKLTLNAVEFSHSGRTQVFNLKPIRTGAGGFPRHAFVCQCGRPVIKLYFRHARLACRRCSGAIHASQALDKHTRPILQAHRLRAFIKLKPLLWHRTRQRLQARLKPSPELTRPRIDDRARLPVSNYASRACPLSC
jgi:hypothetical protein